MSYYFSSLADIHEHVLSRYKYCTSNLNMQGVYIYVTELLAVTVSICIAAMQRKPLLCLIVPIALISFGAAGFCIFAASGELATGTQCYRLFKTFESALIEREGNLYQMRKAFFYSPYAEPVLLKVVYHITYGDNVTLSLDNLTLFRR